MAPKTLDRIFSALFVAAIVAIVLFYIGVANYPDDVRGWRL